MTTAHSLKLPLFRWDYVPPQGAAIASSASRLQGAVFAPNAVAARTRVLGMAELLPKLQGLAQNPQALRVRRCLLRPSLRQLRRQLAPWPRHLAALLQSGLPLLPALQILQYSSTEPAVQAVQGQILHHVQQGLSLHRALDALHPLFDTALVQLVAAGEHGAQLVPLLQRAAAQHEHQAHLRQRLITAMIYPVTVIVASMVLVGVFLRLVVPVFGDLYARNASALPWSTQVVLDIAQGLESVRVWLALVACGLLALFALRALLRSPLSLRLPIYGSLVRQAAVAQWAHTLALLLSSGLPLHSALKTVAQCHGQALFVGAQASMLQAVTRGAQLHQACVAPWFDHSAQHMLAIGEQSAQLETMLQHLAAHYQQQLQLTLERSSKLVEPLLIMFLGLVIGSLVLALYLPIFQLGQLMGHGS